MKKALLVVVLFSVVGVFAQTDDKATLKQLNQNLVSSYKNNKLDDALKFANQALDLCLKLYGAENTETAVAYSNLGFIQREKTKYSASILSFQKSLEIYVKTPNSKGNGLIETYNNLALSQFWDKKYEEAILNYLKVIELSEIKFGKESKELVSPTLDLANTYLKDKKYEKADEYYLKNTYLAQKLFGKGSIEFLRIEFLRERDCNRNKARDELYSKARKELLSKELEPGSAGVINAGQVNGKAILLARPVYPAEAKEKRLSGSVSVKILTDDDGNVVLAQAECGKGILGDSAEDAALQSKFSPTLLKGKRVRISGTVTYNFVAR
jgi:TonB family protein